MHRLRSTTNNSYDHLETLNNINPMSTGTTAAMEVGHNDEDAIHGVTREDEKRRIKLVMLMQQLDFLFYALVVSCYIIDGKNLIFILRTVSEVQFSQPKQIRPDRPLRFFTLASFAICVCGLLSHLSLLSSSNYKPHGILVDLIGQSAWKHQSIAVIFLIGLDLSSCCVQLLLVLISFTQSHSISIYVAPSAGSSQNSLMIAIGQNDVESRESQSSPTSGSAPTSQLKSVPTEDPLMNENSELLGRAHQYRSTIMTQSFLFDLTISEVFSCLLSTNPPTNSFDLTAVIATPTSASSPSRAFESANVSSIIPESSGNFVQDLANDNSPVEPHHQEHISPSARQSLASSHPPSRSVNFSAV